MFKIITLATCHNRSFKTLSTLRTLNNQVLPSNILLEHVIVDDGSTDGTSVLIKNEFPNVKILKGDGSLYWAGGMRLGWHEYVKHHNFQLLFVYNDDTKFHRDALKRLINTYNDVSEKYGNTSIIITGSCTTSCNNYTSYGGQKLLSGINPLRFHRCDPPKSSYTIVDTLNMNCALINNQCLSKHGFLSSYFIHGMADFEYGLRVKKNGGKIILSNGYHGVCDRNIDIKYNSIQNVFDYIKWITSKKNKPVLTFFRFYSKYGGKFWLFHFLLIYINKKFFKLILNKL